MAEPSILQSRHRSAGRTSPPVALLPPILALLDTRPALALQQAEEVCAHHPSWPDAALVACRALRRLGRTEAALPRLAELVRLHPQMFGAAWEYAQALAEAGETAAATAMLRRLTRHQPGAASIWSLLAAELRKGGHTAEGWRADLSGVQAASRDPELVRAALAMNEGRLSDAAAVLDERVARLPSDPAGRRLLGEVRWREGDIAQAIDHVEQALVSAPGFDLAREFLIRLLLQANRLADASAQATILAGSPAAHPGQALLRASVLVRLGDQQGAAAIYQALLATEPAQPQVWQNLGHVLKTLGRQEEAIHAYRQAVLHRPAMGEAWWSLANLKTVTLDPADVAAMEQALRGLGEPEATSAEDRLHLHFALGKALEDAASYAGSFHHYAEGNRLRRALIRHDAADFSFETAAIAGAFTPAFIASQMEGGCDAPDPIFIVGLPRSGSTLIEQILSSHSDVEGTMELPEMMMIASRLQSRVESGEFASYSAMLTALSPLDRTRLGEEYVALTRVHRKTKRPFFIDKMPNNWQNVGLIKLLLPRAKIVDVRRNPLSCCFSAWKQHFARGQAFSYDLAEVGSYYNDYLAMMRAYDAVAPGAVHRVIYEDVVQDLAGQVAKLLHALDLPFQEACLAFHRNARPVRTASSEQVRRPIYSDGVEHWRHYQAWLGPLAIALGTTMDTWRDVALPRQDQIVSMVK